MWCFGMLDILGVSWCSCLACIKLKDNTDKFTEPLRELPEGELWLMEDSISMSEIGLEKWMLELGLVGDLITPHHGLHHQCIGGEEYKYVAYIPRWIRMWHGNWIGKAKWLEWAFWTWILLVRCMVGIGTRMRNYSVGWGAQVKSKSWCGVTWKNGLGEFG